jgi:1-acyl-sn-glycerol-3-phosphate acyltransferase
MTNFDDIRPFDDSEVQRALKDIINHPFFKSIMEFSHGNDLNENWKKDLLAITTVTEFQEKFSYPATLKVLEKSADSFSVSGLDQLDKNESYLFISNHRDILLDTCLLNVGLHEAGFKMTSSAIGDNLIQKSFLHNMAKLNRNFIVRRGLSPKQLLESSRNLALYIKHLLLEDNRSVWIAQREGRTKDGNDQTHSGVLKMLAMAAADKDIFNYFNEVKVVPVAISYEYDPTDALKMPQLLAEANDLPYIKDKNEDFVTFMSGLVGQKKRIHIHVCRPLTQEIKHINESELNFNKQIEALGAVIDDAIIKNYKLWPTNYIAADLIKNTNTFEKFYTTDERELFIRRLERKLDKNNLQVLENFLNMYANPVFNQMDKS